MKQLESLVDRWLAEAETLERYADQRGAEVCRLHAAELREAIHRQESDTLALAQAAEVSGYSKDHLGALVRDGTIENAGRKNAPRVRRGDVPMKPGGRVSSGFDATAEAGKILRMVKGKKDAA